MSPDDLVDQEPSMTDEEASQIFGESVQISGESVTIPADNELPEEERGQMIILPAQAELDAAIEANDRVNDPDQSNNPGIDW